MSNDTFNLIRGSTPLLVSVPHAGREIAQEVGERLVPRAAATEDADWHLERLYAFVLDIGAGLIVPRYSRFVVDLNRPNDDAPMYPGVNNTELCPTRFFTGDALYREGHEPDRAEVDRRVQRYWQPYHDALRDELDRLRALFGHAILFDGHSIKSELPWLFEGQLDDLNLGTVGATSCATSLRDDLAAVLNAQTRFSQVVDGRFKGGHITRHYGRPQRGIHAVQLEMCWRCYMQEAAPYDYDPQRAAQVLPLLRQLVQTLLAWKPHA